MAIEAPLKRPRPAIGEDGEHITFCRICEPCCGLKAQVADGRITKISPDRDNPHSLGHVCVKGTSFQDIVHDPDRVLKPLRRTGAPGEFEEVSWDDALEDISDRLAAIIREDGPDAVAAYLGNPTFFGISGALSYGQLFDHFGIWKAFGSATQDASPRFMANYIIYGSSFRLPLPDLPRCDFLLMVGANMLVSHGSGVSAPRLREDLDAIAARGRIVVIDPRRTETAARYEHIPVRPDTDAWLLGAMLNVIFDCGLVDQTLLNDRTLGWEKLRDVVRDLTPELAETYSGVPASRIVELAIAFAQTKRGVAYGRVGTCRGSHSSLVNMFICALNIVTGKFAQEGGWAFGDSPLAMTPPPAFEVHQTRFGPQTRIGNHMPMSFLVDDIVTDGPGQTKALIIAAGNIALSAPGGAALDEALENLSLFVSTDFYVNETNRFADYILPGTTFMEREDVPFTALSYMVRPAIQYTAAVLPPQGESRDDHVICNLLAAALHERLTRDPGVSGYAGEQAPAFDPIAAIDAMLGMGGVTVKAGNEENVPLSIDLLLDYPHGIAVAENLACTNSWSKLLHEDGKLHLWHDLLDPEIERLNATMPPKPDELRLFGRRDIRSINSWMHNSQRLVRSQRPELLMHQGDAKARGLSSGDLVSVRSDYGEMQVNVSISSDIVAGSVCYPHGWGHKGGWRNANSGGGANVNLLAPLEAVEKISATSFLDGIPVTVEPATAHAGQGDGALCVRQS
jgi:anaerobic selenocysteine-containing dehydrogenase